MAWRLVVAVVGAAFAVGMLGLSSPAMAADEKEATFRQEQKGRDELKELMSDIVARLERMQQTIDRLTAENAELRRALERERAARLEAERAGRPGDAERPRPAGDVPRREGQGDRPVGREGDRGREGEVNRQPPARGEGEGDRATPVRREGPGDGQRVESDRPRREGEGDRLQPARREGEADRREGEVKATFTFLRGTFVKLVEQKLGDLEHLGLVVRPGEGQETVTLYVPMRRDGDRWVRDERLAALARKLASGQRLVVSWRMVEGDRFVTAIEPEAAPAERERAERERAERERAERERAERERAERERAEKEQAERER